MTAAVTVGAVSEAVRQDVAREHRSLLLLASPAVALILIFLMLPMLWIFAQSFFDRDGHFGIMNYAQLFADGAYAASFWLTIRLAATVTFICAVLGYVLAYGMTLMPGWAARLCLAMVALPFWTSILVRTYAWLVLLQHRGIVNNALMDLGIIEERLPMMHNLTGTLIGMVHIMLPFMVFPLYAGLQRIDSDYTRAATGLGASAMYTFRRVYFPLSLPGLIAGAVLTFVVSLGFYITPAILGGGRTIVIALAIERDINLNTNWGPASASAVLFVLAVLVIFAALGRFGSVQRLFNR